jgi:hypothetical protein
MKTKFCCAFLGLLLAGGVRLLLERSGPSPLPKSIEPIKSPPPPEEKLRELVVPQREEAKKVPERLYSLCTRDAPIQDVLLSFSKEAGPAGMSVDAATGRVNVDAGRGRQFHGRSEGLRRQGAGGEAGRPGF